MAWRLCAAVTAILVAVTGPLASRPTFKGLLRRADATPGRVTPTIRRRAMVAKRQSDVARGAGGFAARRGLLTSTSGCGLVRKSTSEFGCSMASSGRNHEDAVASMGRLEI